MGHQAPLLRVVWLGIQWVAGRYERLRASQKGHEATCSGSRGD